MTWNYIKLPHPAGCRVPTSADDFGDELTINLNIKRRIERLPSPQGVLLNKDNNHEQFGIYAGHREDCPLPEKWCVVLKDVMWNPVGVECYATLEALKEDWELD